jgi:hypothetical protein
MLAMRPALYHRESCLRAKGAPLRWRIRVAAPHSRKVMTEKERKHF